MEKIDIKFDAGARDNGSVSLYLPIKSASPLARGSGCERRPHSNRLLTNAKKVTVSVLYWYEKLSSRSNRLIFGKALKRA